MVALIFINAAFSANKQNNNTKEPIRVEAGIYITNLYNFNFKEKRVNAIYWVWFLYPKDSGYSDEFDIINAESIDILYSGKDVYEDKNLVWSYYKIKSRLFQQWDFSNFPFGAHKVQISIEHMLLDANDLQYIPDTVNSGIDQNLKLSGWLINGHQAKEKDRRYQSNFGDPIDPQNSTYSWLYYSIDISQSNFKLFFKVFGLLYLATILIIAIFFVPITEIRSRIALNSGAIFSVVGNKISTDNLLPPSRLLSLIDQLQLSTLILMIVVLSMTIYLNLLYAKNVFKARLLNAIFGVVSLLFIIFMNVFIYMRF